MALESATYINQLVQANPTLADPKSQGDDHIRLIKKVLQQTFPNLTGAVTPTQAQLNTLADATLFFKPNMVIAWAGTIETIPVGWMLCNGVGTTSTGLPIPNLHNKFIVGAGNLYAVGATGGSTTHDHFLSINGTALTVDQMPLHSHGGIKFQVPGGSGFPGFDGSGDAYTTGTSDSTGGGQAHSHSGNTVPGVNSLPPYYAMAFIIKY
ncbi:MAG TPA: hypothetical protein VJM50_18660 [Pyrinomonadaceae bacterium]|nr:hypothetical protein [Pyrinomonadaceae bacterium]